jgi:hypothetical protein
LNSKPPEERLREIFESTVESGLKYDGNIDEIDFYSLFCKSTANNQLYKIFSCNLSMFNCKYENDNAILIIFSIPLSLNLDGKIDNGNQQENKHISERIMDIVKIVEEVFIVVDYMDLQNVKEDKFMYMVIVKKLKDGGIEMDAD